MFVFFEFFCLCCFCSFQSSTTPRLVNVCESKVLWKATCLNKYLFHINPQLHKTTLRHCYTPMFVITISLCMVHKVLLSACDLFSAAKVRAFGNQSQPVLHCSCSPKGTVPLVCFMKKIHCLSSLIHFVSTINFIDYSKYVDFFSTCKISMSLFLFLCKMFQIRMETFHAKNHLCLLSTCAVLGGS